MKDNRVVAWQRLEGLLLFVTFTFLFGWFGGSWIIWPFVLLLPDVSMVGYLFNKRFGAFIYNAGHALVLPLLLLFLTFLTKTTITGLVACVWLAHIGLDRMLGYGLKLGDGFSHTHLGRIGK
jgi:hypothetical protein